MAGVPFNPMAASAPKPLPSAPVTVPQAVSGGLAKLRGLKATAPNAQGMSDAQFAVSLHQHYYRDLPMVDYLANLGLDRGDVLYELRVPGDPYGDYVREALANAGKGESRVQASTRLGGSLEDRRPGNLEGTMRAGLQGATFGFGDEIVGAGAATLDPLFRPGSGKSWGERFNTYMGNEQGLIDKFRQDNPIAAYGAEFAGALPTAMAGPIGVMRNGPGWAKVAGGMGASAAEGAVYGFGSTNGSLEDRSVGAGIGAAFGTAGGLMAPLVVKGGQAAVRKFLQGRAANAAIKRAPSAATIKAGARASYKAAENTGAILDQNALMLLQHDMRQILDGEGLLMPASGTVAGDYPKVKGAMDMLAEYTAGPMTIKQAQTLMKRFRKVAGSTDPQEARIGMLMLDQFDNFMENLPAQAFSKGNGTDAMQHWARARKEYARFKRTDAIEQAIYKARLNKGGFAEGLRSEFASILRSNKKKRGFTPPEIEAMERYVGGGSINDFLKFIQSGGTFPVAVTGHLFGGPLGGVAAAGAKMTGGALAGGVRNAGARKAAAELRAQVALPNGLPSLPSPPGGPVIDGVARRVGAVTGAQTSAQLPPLPQPMARMYGGR